LVGTIAGPSLHQLVEEVAVHPIETLGEELFDDWLKDPVGVEVGEVGIEDVDDVLGSLDALLREMRAAACRPFHRKEEHCGDQ